MLMHYPDTNSYGMIQIPLIMSGYDNDINDVVCL